MFAWWHPHIPTAMNDVCSKLPTCKPNYSFYNEIEKIRFYIQPILAHCNLQHAQFWLWGPTAIRLWSPIYVFRYEFACMRHRDPGKAEQYKHHWTKCSGLQWVSVLKVLCSPMSVKQHSLKLRPDIKEILHSPVQARNSLKSPPLSQDLYLYVFLGIK